MAERKPAESKPYTTLEYSAQGGAGALLMSDPEHPAPGAPPLLRGLNQDEIAEILAAGAQKILNRGATLFRQGDRHNGIYLIESGRLRVFYAAPSGREITLAYWNPGNFVGGPDIFDSGVHVWSGVAVANSRILHLPGEILRRMIVKFPALNINVIEGLAFKGRCYSGLAQMLGTRSATERLAHLLLHLTTLYGVEENGGMLIAANFTHADIANMIGSTRQWVTISLKRYAETGVIDVERANLMILRPDLLAEIRDGHGKKPRGGD